MFVRGLMAGALLTAATVQAQAASCDKVLPFKDRVVANISAVGQIVPLGNLNPEHGHTIPTRHMYVVPKKDAELSVHAPVAAEIVAAVFHPPGSDPNNQSQTEDEWELHLRPCDGVTLYLNHLVGLNPNLLAKIEPVPPIVLDNPEPANAPKKRARLLSISIASGDLIGSAKRSFDIGLVDTRTPPLPFANPARYAPNIHAILAQFKLPAGGDAEKVVGSVVPQALFARCALDYFDATKRQEMYALLASEDGSTKVKSRVPCGTNMKDINGSAQGNWWSEQNAQNSFLRDEMALSLSTSNVDPSVPLFSINDTTPVGIAPNIYGFTPTPSPVPVGMETINRHFSQVEDMKIYCYQGLTPPKGGVPLNAIVLLQRELNRSGDRLRIEFQFGKQICSEVKTPWAFGPNAITLYR